MSVGCGYYKQCTMGNPGCCEDLIILNCRTIEKGHRRWRKETSQLEKRNSKTKTERNRRERRRKRNKKTVIDKVRVNEIMAKDSTKEKATATATIIYGAGKGEKSEK